jgi:hypothetical protein
MLASGVPRLLIRPGLTKRIGGADLVERLGRLSRG